MTDSDFLTLLKRIAIGNILVVSIIMLDFLLVAVPVKRAIKEFNAERITSRSLRSTTTIVDYYVDMADGERIYLKQRSPLKNLMFENEILLVYDTPILQRAKYIESYTYNIKEEVSMLHSTSSLLLVLSALIIPVIHLWRPKPHNLQVLLVIVTTINIYMVFMYFYRF